MTLYVNNSLLSLLAECETKAWIRWGRELIMTEREGPGPLEAGHLIHTVLERWLLGEPHVAILADWNRLQGEVYCGELPKEERLHPGNVRLVLEHWLLAQEGRVRDFETLGVERVVEVELGRVDGEEIIYYGTPDALIEWKGEQYILEHKSTGNMDGGWQASWAMKAQLQGYVWALRQQGVEVKGAFVNGLEVRKLPPWDGNYLKKCGTHKVRYEECQGLHVKHAWVGPLWWSGARLDQWRRDALAGAQRLQQIRQAAEGASLGIYGGAGVKMDGQFRWPGCQRCQYQRWCNAGRPTERVEEMMSFQPWRRGEDADSED